MTTFSESVRKYEQLCEENNVPAETVMAFRVELSQKERYNLYMNFDNEMPEDLKERFDEELGKAIE